MTWSCVLSFVKSLGTMVVIRKFLSHDLITLIHEQRMQIYILKRHFVHTAVMLTVFVTSVSYTLLNFPESRHACETCLAGVIALLCFLCATILKGS